MPIEFIKIFKRNKRGSILASSLVTLGILLVLLAASIPFFRQYQPNMRLTSAARALTTDLRYAQQLTIAEQVPHLVQLNILLNNYQILKTGAATTMIKTVDLPSDIHYQSVIGFTDDQVRFNSYGAVAESGDIVLYNTNGQTLTISIKPSGYVQLVQ
jgi:Tfp pilus assembly protein FimT